MSVACRHTARQGQSLLAHRRNNVKMSAYNDGPCGAALRPTTRTFINIVTRGHFRSRDEDGGHNIRSAIAEKPMLHANFMLYIL